MGNFYTNYTLRGPSQESVAAALAGRSAIVTPAQDGCVVVFDEESDEQNPEVIAELASRLSGAFHCPLLAVLNHDDDIFWYQLYLNGELVNEYNSSPDYFDSAAEEASPPEGGDAQKLCIAFGATTVAKVKKILGKSSFDDDGYTFAVERHADLADALGIPSYSVGAGFCHVSDWELPEGLDEKVLVMTKDLVALQPNPQALDNIDHRPVAGYYKVSFRAHPQRTRSIPIGWMPNLWADLECSEQDLSENFRQATAAHREKFKHFGFAEQGFKKPRQSLNPNIRDHGAINYLDSGRCYFGQLIYGKWRGQPPRNVDKEHITISFTAVFQNEVLSCNNSKSPFEPLPNHTVVRVESNDVAFIYEQFVEHRKQRTDPPRRFPDLQSLQAWFDATALETFEDRVRRGTWIRMSDYEVAAARRKMTG